jgi:class 3 adenylate cyclase/tetratricopeptide (TPR) repeat protein
MRCPQCAHENPQGVKFCGECGARLQSPCAACGVLNPPTNKFCQECGAPLTEASTTPKFASPQAYTPKHLAEKILTSKGAIEGERKGVTVMFSDVSGFTAMSERLDPEDVHAIMDRAFEVILREVHRYEGTINQFLGDGVMALFGAPIAHEDHAHRALSAALAIQQELKPLADEVRGTHGVEFRMRMGINTGLVVVGAIGKDLRMDYTAVGDTTNLAARLLSLARPGQIVVSRRTQHLREEFFTFEDLGEFQVKGKTEPVRAYALIGEIHGRTRLEVSKERGLTPLFGRERELGRLTEAYRRAAGGEGAIVLLAGDPGVGKSRLLYEFLQGLENAGVLELDATCVSYGRSMPYYPILGLLRRYFGHAEGMTGEEIRQSVTEQLQLLGLEGDERAVLLAHFLGISAPKEFLDRLSSDQLRERTFGVLRDVFLRASEAAPVLLVVENLHWIDASSEEFLAQLARSLSGHRVLLVLSTRPGLTAPWLTAAAAQTITLEGLDAGQVQEMTRTLLAAEEVSEPLFKILVEKSEGNPLYVEEILRQLQETGGIVVEQGEARPSSASVTVPATIQDIIAARVDRLAQPLKQTLQGAAIVGRRFGVLLLSRVLGVTGDEVDAHLRELHGLDFVFPSAQDPAPMFSFKHALTQEVVYAGVLERRRRVYHAAAGVGLEALYADRTDEVVELLAYHFGRSAEAEKAVDYDILAAAKAQRRWANAEAVAHFESATKRLETMPDSEPNRLRRIDAVVKQAEVMFALGRHAGHVRALESIRELTVHADPQRRAAWLCWVGFLHSLTGARPEIPIVYCSEAVALADLAGLDDIRAFAECCLTHVYVVAGKLREAVETGERALAFFETRGNVWWACRTLWGLSMACNAIGEWEKSLAYCRRGLEHGQAINDLRLKTVGWWRTGSTHIQRGDAEAGVRCCDEALVLSPIQFDAAMARALKGYGLAKAGKTEEGIALLEDVVAWLDESHLPYTRSLIGLLLAESYLRAGEQGRARAVAETVLGTSRQLGYLHSEGWAERLLGECLCADDRRAAAEHLARAAWLLEAIDAENELAKTLVAQAELRMTSGDEAGARGLVDRALGIFEALGTLDGPDRARRLLAAG